MILLGFKRFMVVFISIFDFGYYSKQLDMFWAFVIFTLALIFLLNVLCSVGIILSPRDLETFAALS